jgi:hypothetical protein
MSLFTLFLVACGGGCGHDDDDHHDSDGLGTDDSELTDDSGATDDSGIYTSACDEPGEFSVPITGKVQVALYGLDIDGELESVSFEDRYGGDFPFGGIWVSAYVEEEDGSLSWLDEEVVREPSVDGDDYALDLTSETCGKVHVYAVLDLNGDRVLGPDEPSGIHPEALKLKPGKSHSDADVEIVVGPVANDGSVGGWSPGDGTGSGNSGGSGPGYVTVSGLVDVVQAYTAGDVAAMVFGTDGSGPHLWDIIPSADLNDYGAAGADGAYAMGLAENSGSVQLFGAWDADDNWLFDYSDPWGEYASALDVSGNPVSVGASDLPDHDIQVPLGGGDPPFSIVPFVTLSGDLGVVDGDFDDLDAGSTVYVAALKYRPTTDVTVAQVTADAYDLQSWSQAELSGSSSQPYELSVPQGTILYVWAYVDADSDGTLNEEGEHVGNPATAEGHGRMNSGEAGFSGLGIQLGAQEIVEE